MIMTTFPIMHYAVADYEWSVKPWKGSRRPIYRRRRAAPAAKTTGEEAEEGQDREQQDGTANDGNEANESGQKQTAATPEGDGAEKPAAEGAAADKDAQAKTDTAAKTPDLPEEPKVEMVEYIDDWTPEVEEKQARRYLKEEFGTSEPWRYFMTNPHLYQIGLRGECFSQAKLVGYIFYGLFFACSVFCTVYVVECSLGATLSDGHAIGLWVAGDNAYGLCVIVVNLALY